MEILRLPLIEYGVAAYVLPGQSESGDRHLVRNRSDGILIAVIDGLGHGDEAANAAKLAVSTIEDNRDESVLSLVQLCHENLRSTRGVVMSLASIDPKSGLMTWVGIGNVQAVILRRQAAVGSEQEELLLRGGVIGAQLPPLHAAVVPIARGDTLVFATDGIRNEFLRHLSLVESPQRLADKLLGQYSRGNDDALVLVLRYLENHT